MDYREQVKEPAPWCPNGITPLGAPKERPQQDLRFRPARPLPEVPPDQRERTRVAVMEQCLNSRIPGYTGFLPSARAEDIYGRTQADVGRSAVTEQTRRQHLRETATSEALAAMDTRRSGLRTPSSAAETMAPAPDAHPLGKSRAEIVRHHWVPTIPGYGGFVPAKHAENICGGGIIHTCKMAGRAIAERTAPPDVLPPVTQQDDLQRSRLNEYFLTQKNADKPGKLAADLRDHCAKQIPGYMGFIPRVKAESIYGSTVRGVNLIAADFCEDRIFNREAHGDMCNAPPQVPRAKQLRL